MLLYYTVTRGIFEVLFIFKMLIHKCQYVSIVLLVFVNGNGGQDEISELEQDNLVGLVDALVEKVGGLEVSMEEIKQDEIQQDNLIETVNTLVEKVGGLEDELRELKRENIFLKTKGATTCSDLKESGFEESGMYDIDPDSSGTSIQVYCDMLTGTTEISHDITDSVDIGYCSGDGCFNQEYSYSGPPNQIEALISASSTCEQEIKFDCNIAPLKNSMFGFYYGWWVDRNGQKKFYFDGADEDLHVCGCYPNCHQSMFNNTCNCDASLIAWWNLDSGKITNKDHLPIKSFSYGGFISAQQRAKITIGNLRCSGSGPSSSELASSCSSLKREGSTVSGFYLTKPSEDANLQVSYCRMEQSGYREDDLRVGDATDINQRTRMITIGVTSFVFQNGANFSSTWKNLIELRVDTSAVKKDLNEFGIELDFNLGTINFRQSGVYIFINIKRVGTNTAWQLGSGYNGRYNFEKVYYIEKDKQISFTGHGSVKYFELGIIPLYQI